MRLHLKNFKSRPGEHCETSTLGMMLAHEGLDLSEAMIFGLGAGLDFRLWPSPLPRQVMPIASGRIDSGNIARNAASRRRWSAESGCVVSGRSVRIESSHCV